jgi:thiamine biosynthesis lipoprotein
VRAFLRICVGNLLLAGATLFAQSTPLRQEPQLFSINHPAMGTTFTLYLYATNKDRADAEAAPVFEEIDRIEDLLSNYRESSELSRINREAGQGIVTTDPETFVFLKTSIDWSARSQGAFDITVGQLMKAWGFFNKRGRIPTDAELGALRKETGWQKVRLDPSTRTVHFTSPGIELDPGGHRQGLCGGQGSRHPSLGACSGRNAVGGKQYDLCAGSAPGTVRMENRGARSARSKPRSFDGDTA